MQVGRKFFISRTDDDIYFKIMEKSLMQMCKWGTLILVQVLVQVRASIAHWFSLSRFEYLKRHVD